MSQAAIEKVTVIGGGSTYTPELIDGFIKHENDLQVGEIALYDIDEERLNVVGGMAQRMVGYAELDTKVTLNLNRPKAIDGAKFVLSSMRIGHMAARILDEKIPLKYNVIGQETTGPGGTFKALRTIPVTLDIARDMEKYAPDAWYINFTNPSGIMTEAILKHTNLKVVGLCNNPINTIAAMAEGFHVEPKDVFLEWMGLNHVNWVRKIYIKGQDVTQQVFDNLEEMAEIKEMPKIAPELVRTLGVLPTYYLQYYYFHPQRLAEAKAAEKTRGEVVLEVEKELLKKYADPKELVKPPELAQARRGTLFRSSRQPDPIPDARPAGCADRSGAQRQQHRRPAAGCIRRGALRCGCTRRDTSEPGTSAGIHPGAMPAGQSLGIRHGQSRDQRIAQRRDPGHAAKPAGTGLPHGRQSGR